MLAVLGAYLAVLVPMNWALFRLLRRVEWAWIAAPIISLSCAALVVWAAQLDIGFSRSSTELAILEIEAGYPRAHLTRYTALYASLSTSYTLTYDEPSALALPFGRADYRLLPGESRRQLFFSVEGSPRLRGVDVSSNSTGMVHSEEFRDLGGTIAWNVPDQGPPELVNATRLSISGARLLRLAPDDKSIETFWIGDLLPGARIMAGAWRQAPATNNAPASDAPTDASARPIPPSGADIVPVEVAARGEAKRNLGMDLSGLVSIAEDRRDIAPGEVRLIGWTTDTPSGVTISPRALERRRAALVVAHLAREVEATIHPDIWPTDSERIFDPLAPRDPDRALDVPPPPDSVP